MVTTAFKPGSEIYSLTPHPRPAHPNDQRPGERGGGEGVSQDTDVRAADPVLGRMADAILIPPFPGTAAPGWILDALGRGLAGVTLFGQNISAPGQVSALTAALRAGGGGRRPGDRDRRGGR